jgi:hypothetical protein
MLGEKLSRPLLCFAHCQYCFRRDISRAKGKYYLGGAVVDGIYHLRTLSARCLGSRAPAFGFTSNFNVPFAIEVLPVIESPLVTLAAFASGLFTVRATSD